MARQALSVYGLPVGGVQAGPAGLAGPMVGRDNELARVTSLLDHALGGHGRLVLCTGEAGIGKTRLAEELAALAAARSAPVAWARAADRGSLPPYGFWRLLLAEPAVRDGAGGESRADLWDRGGSRVFGDAERPALADDAGSSSAQRFALFAEGPAAADRGGRAQRAAAGA